MEVNLCQSVLHVGLLTGGSKDGDRSSCHCGSGKQVVRGCGEGGRWEGLRDVLTGRVHGIYYPPSCQAQERDSVPARIETM